MYTARVVHKHARVIIAPDVSCIANFAVPGEAEASGHALILAEDAVRGPYHRGPRPRGLPRHQ